MTWKACYTSNLVVISTLLCCGIPITWTKTVQDRFSVVKNQMMTSSGGSVDVSVTSLLECLIKCSQTGGCVATNVGPTPKTSDVTAERSCQLLWNVSDVTRADGFTLAGKL